MLTRTAKDLADSKVMASMNQIPLDDESELLQGLRAGQPPAFEQLVRRHGGWMLVVAERILAHHDDARDAVQDAFLSAFQSLDKFDERSRLSTWLHRIVVNASLMKLRGKRRRPENAIDGLLPAFLADGHQANPKGRWSNSVLELLQRTEIQSAVRTKIDSLPDSFRIVLVLRDIEELDTDTVAGLLQLTPGAVKVRLHRARQALRTLLEPLFAEPDK